MLSSVFIIFFRYIFMGPCRVSQPTEHSPSELPQGIQRSDTPRRPLDNSLEAPRPSMAHPLYRGTPRPCSRPKPISVYYQQFIGIRIAFNDMASAHKSIKINTLQRFSPLPIHLGCPCLSRKYFRYIPFVFNGLGVSGWSVCVYLI